MFISSSKHSSLPDACVTSDGHMAAEPHLLLHSQWSLVAVGAKAALIG